MLEWDYNLQLVADTRNYEETQSVDNSSIFQRTKPSIKPYANHPQSCSWWIALCIHTKGGQISYQSKV